MERDQFVHASGFLTMLGGALLVFVLVFLAGVRPDLVPTYETLTSGEGVSFAVYSVASTLLLLPAVCLSGGVVGLYWAQRRHLGPVGTAGAAVMLASLVLWVAVGTLNVTGEFTWMPAYAAVDVGTLLGSAAFGAATARAGVLPGAREGGGLVAAGLPAGGVAAALLWLAGVRVLLLAGAVVLLPWMAGWLVLGYGLVSLPDTGGVPAGPGDARGGEA